MSRWSHALVFAVVLAGCETGSSAPLSVPEVVNGIELSTSRTTLATPRTWNAVADISVFRTGSFSDAVTLTVDGAPLGVVASFSAVTLAAGITSTRLNVEVDSTAAYGTYPLTVRAVGAGVSASTVIINLIIPRPSFVLALDPPFVYRQEPAYLLAIVKMTVTRDSTFQGAVEVARQDLPAGIVAPDKYTITPNFNSVEYFLTITPSVAAGSYPVTFRATGKDADPRTVTATVVVPVR